MTTRVPLGKGLVAFVDEGDHALVAPLKWKAMPNYSGGHYAIANVDGKMVSMHRLILGAKVGQWVDHANNDGLDNRRANIRLCTPSQNAMNRHRVRGAIPLRGVAEVYGGFSANITADYVVYRLGVFDTPEEAGRMYDAACRILHGEFGHLNFPDEQPVPLGPVSVTSRAGASVHPAMASHIVPNMHDVWREQRRARLVERQRRMAEIAEANAAVLPKLSPRHAEIVSTFLASRHKSEAAAKLGISRERVRQVVEVAIGKGLQLPIDAYKPKPKYPEHIIEQVIAASNVIGVTHASQVYGVAYTNLRAWRAARPHLAKRLSRGPSILGRRGGRSTQARELAKAA